MAGKDDSFNQLVRDINQPATRQPVYAETHYQAPAQSWEDSHIGLISWGAVGVIAFVVLVLLGRYSSAKIKKDAEWKQHLSTVHGSAAWMTTDQLVEDKLVGDKASGVILGEIGGAGGALVRFGDDGHVLTFAPTGAGKGVSAVIPNLLTYPGSMVVIDPKGENAFVTARRRREMGQAVHILDPFGKMGENHVSAAFNPLDWINPDGDQAAEDAALLAEALAPPDGRSSDPFWSNEARSLLSGLLLYIAAHEPPENRNLGRLRDLLSLGPNEWKGLLEQMSESPNRLVAGAGNRIRQKADKEAAGVLSTAQSHTHFLDSLKIRAVTAKTTVNLMDLKKKLITVYLVLPADQLQNHGRWLRLMISMLLRSVTMTDERPDDDVLFMLDEFAALGSLPMIKQAFGLMRGYGLKIWPILQDLPQLRGLYKDDWQTFIANAGAIQAFGVNDRTTAEFVSGALGQKTVGTESENFSDRSKSESISLMGRNMLMPDELLRLPKTVAIVLMRGKSPLACHKVVYHKDKRFSKLADPNPYVRKEKT